MAVGTGADGPTAKVETYAEVQNDWDLRFKAFVAKFRMAKTDDERARVKAADYPVSRGYVERMMAIARRDPNSAEAADALIFIGRLSTGPESEEPLRLLARDHARHPRIGGVCITQSGNASPTVDALNRRVLADNPTRQVRTEVTYAMARRSRSEGERDQDQRKLAEAERHYEAVIRDSRDLKNGQAETTLAQAATAELFEMTRLATGGPAPDLVGEDLDGRPLSLSGFRGRVVVLSFWGTWCPGCMEFVPEERALVERLKGRPFALVGVDSDSDREKTRQRVAKEGMTWPSFWGGEAIAARWNVRAWPTLFVVDHRGIIRHKFIGPPDRGILDATLAPLLAEVEKSATAR
jgi:thiol-disulfide isomerase/thioredoxin